MKERMKKAFNEVHKAVLACEDADGRKRCELFRELPDRRVCVLPPYPQAEVLT